MKRFFIITFVLLFGFRALSQEIIVQHNTKGPYVEHTVSPKENFYSLGRLYNVPPKDIASFNNIEMEKGLSIGQTVSIPLTSQNFTQESSTGNPVYYVVGEKEGLYRVSLNNNKVLMASLRKWNALNTDVISAGQKLIVGFIVSNEMTATNLTKPAAQPKAEIARGTEEKTVQTKEPERVVAKTETAPERRTEIVAEKKSEPQKAVSASVNEGKGGYFKTSFDAQVKTQPLQKDEMAAAGIFKTASGWQDAKYYALLDGVEPGTIVRVVNPNNNKAVYAKVLDKMTGIRQNQGYDIRISNAAATALDINETDKFFVRVNY